MQKKGFNLNESKVRKVILFSDFDLDFFSQRVLFMGSVEFQNHKIRLRNRILLDLVNYKKRYSNLFN